VAASADAALLLTDSDVDALAWEFLNSEQAGGAYAGRSFGRRLEAYLRRRDLARGADDGDLCSILADRVLTYLGEARRPGRTGGSADRAVMRSRDQPVGSRTAN
jgi:hypothetical protein